MGDAPETVALARSLYDFLIKNLGIIQGLSLVCALAQLCFLEQIVGTVMGLAILDI